jgi:TonB family protein
MSPPDSANRTPSSNREPFTDGGAAFSPNTYSDIAQLTKTLSKIGGGAVAADLALDLVLNEVVEQARLATGATGAAVALARDGEMVCRATTGDHAPELGVRMETVSGLSGECLSTGEVQNCSDTETDARVDSESCRNLGIRSALFMPLSDGRMPFGILQAFSSRPDAFGERDINTLKALAARILSSKKAAENGSSIDEEGSNVGTETREQTSTTEPVIVNQTPHRMEESPVEKMHVEKPYAVAELNDEPNPVEESGGSDVWTTVLVILVIVAAVALGVVIGWRGALQGSVQAPPASPREAHAVPAQGEAHGSVANSPELPPVPTAAPQPDRSVGATPRPGDKRSASNAPEPAVPASGGLTVTENGKVIYRLRGQAISGAESPRPATAPGDSRLIHRVDPEYPVEARDKHIQGPVVLNVQVLQNGSVGNIEIAAGNPLLADAAVRAVKQWKYEPYVMAGQSSQSQTRITIRFTLPSR